MAGQVAAVAGVVDVGLVLMGLRVWNCVLQLGLRLLWVDEDIIMAGGRCL